MSSSEIGTAILEAGGEGNLEKLKEIKETVGYSEFERICRVVSDCSGLRVLHRVAEKGFLDICEFLIESAGIYINVLSDKDDNPLIIAVKEEHVQIVKYLLTKGALVGWSNSEGFTALHYAVMKDNLKLMKLLLKYGAPLEEESVDGTPLQCAASRGSMKAVTLLLENHATVDSNNSLFGSPLISAIKSHSFECMELLLEEGADSDKEILGLNALASAAVEGDTRYLDRLVKAGADQNIPCVGLLPIEYAAFANNVEGVRILFPKTKRIEYYPDWSVEGIMHYSHSEATKSERDERRTAFLLLSCENGKNAVSEKDYESAIASYTMAIVVDPSNEKWLANRSLCFARLERAMHALHDAEACVRLKPKWAKAHYREGSAWKIYTNFHMAALSFKQATILAPEDKEIQAAYKDLILYYYLPWMCLCFPVEMDTLFRQHFGRFIT